jgi:hypothetical protein
MTYKEYGRIYVGRQKKEGEGQSHKRLMPNSWSEAEEERDRGINMLMLNPWSEAEEGEG